MSELEKLALLGDLAKLSKKYGADVFDELASLVERPDFAEQLARILRKTGQKSRAAGTGLRVPRDDYGLAIDELLERVKASNLQKYKLLEEVRKLLFGKEILSTLSELREFVKVHEIGVGYIKARPQGILLILEFLEKNPDPRVGETVTELKKARKEDRSLEGWTRVILKDIEG